MPHSEKAPHPRAGRQQAIAAIFTLTARPNLTTAEHGLGQGPARAQAQPSTCDRTNSAPPWGASKQELVEQVAVATDVAGLALGAYGLARWGYYAYGSRFAAGASAATVVKCFGAGTPVHTEQGLQPIEDIEVGDSVWSIDEETGEVTLEKVTQLFKTPGQQVLELKLEDDSGATETLVATPEHPFLTERGWIAAHNLTENDRIRQRSGGWLRLTSATWVQGTATVYNFEVGGTHTYAVGEAGVWVHNACGDIARRIATRLPSANCYGECKRFAVDLVRGLKREGISGTLVKVRKRGWGIVDGRGIGQLVGSSEHYAVRVGDTLFDNLNPRGAPYKAWRENLGVLDKAVFRPADPYVSYFRF